MVDAAPALPTKPYPALASMGTSTPAARHPRSLPGDDGFDNVDGRHDDIPRPGMGRTAPTGRASLDAHHRRAHIVNGV
jgi:hypothetical protein